jgi:hypothetical protein
MVRWLRAPQSCPKNLLAQSSGGESEEAVVVVHGTFAENADWIQPGSQFLQSLGCRIGKRSIHTFVWSGLNSHKARSEAGQDLALFVNRLCLTESFQRVWCVTHSHGGNVALYALRDSQFAQRLAGIVFFGTPFFHVRPRNIQRFCKVFSWMLGGLASVLFLLSFGVIFSIFMVVVIALSSEHIFWSLSLSIGFFALMGVFNYWAERSRWGQSRRGEHTERKLLEFLSRKQEEICGLVAQPSPSCPTYIAAVPRDEAAFILTSVDDVSTIPWIGWGIAVRALMNPLIFKRT